MSCIVVSTHGFTQDGKWSSHPDTSIFDSYNAYEISVQRLQERANGKFILLYYYEHLTMRVNNFNLWVLGDTAVVNYITSYFYPICLDLDIDKLGPDAPDIKRSKTYRTFLTEQTYYVTATPAFSIYTPTGKLNGTKTFLNAKRETANEVVASFLDWMQKRLRD